MLFRMVGTGGTPWWASSQDSVSQCRGQRFSPCSRKSHMLPSQYISKVEKEKNGGQLLRPPLSHLLLHRSSLVHRGLMSTPVSVIRKSVGLVGTCFVFKITHRLPFYFDHQGEKRKMNDSHVLEETKKPRVMGDIPLELIHEVMSTITDPAAMLGPEVSRGNASCLWVDPVSSVAAPAVGDGVVLPRELCPLFACCQGLRVKRQAG